MEIKETGLADSRSSHTRLYSRCITLSILSLALFLTSVGPSGCAGYTTASTQSTGSKTLSANPTSLSFGNVSVGATATQSATLKNGGTASVTVSQTNVSGAAFSITQGTPPYSVAAGQSVTLQVRFAPSSSGNITGSLTVTSDADNSPTTIALSGSGASATSQLTATPNNVSFGNVGVGSSSSLGVTLKNTGNSNVTISGVTPSGGDYSANGVNANTTLTPGQSATLSVTFTPTATGSASGSVSVTSNANNSPATISLNGSGVTPTAAPQGAPACGMSGDSSNHVPTDWGTFVPPAKGLSYVDPTFGCSVTRITDSSKDIWTGSFYLPITHGYSTVSPFNANDSYLMLTDGFGRRYVTDLQGNTLVPISSIPSGFNDGWFLWDATDPNSFYYTQGNSIIKGTISGSSVTTATVHQFGEYAAINFMDETDVSQDGAHVVVIGGDNTGSSAEDVFVYDFVANTKGPVYTTSCSGVVNNVNNGCLHKLIQTPDNNVIIQFAGDGTGLEQGNRLWSGLKPLAPLQDATNHLDTGYDLNGNAVYVSTVNGSVLPLPGITSPCPSGWGMDVRQINNPLFAVCLLDNQPNWHVGYRGNQNQPWVGLSFFDGGRSPSPEWFDNTSNYTGPTANTWKLYEDEVIVVRVDANNNSNLVYRLAHAYSRSNEDFEAQPHAAISRSGKYIAFTSNMAYAHSGCPANFQTSTGCTDVYVIKIQ
jgi:HYDIN/CFA65/VesB family protein/ASPM-SPD-2-Hydin domain-containing protein